jgi:hypothetical protein
MNKQDLYLVPVPRATDTYAPVSHRNVVDAVLEQLDKHRLIVEKETFNTARLGQQLIGYMDIKHPDSNELGLRLAFRNSYDKSMSVAFTSGCCVWICENGVVAGEIQLIRKHTGNVLTEMNEKIVNSINELDDHFQRILKYSNEMKQRELTLSQASRTLGEMFVEENLILPTQMNVVKQELLKPTFKDFEEESLWSFYNHVTYSFKNSHPTTYLQQHKKFHEFIVDEFSL